MDWLAGGGEMGALMRGKDWAATPLGPAQSWPQSLRTAVSILLNSRYPMFLFWGAQLIKIYNDGYRPITGDKHPWALGRPGTEVWPEIWDDIGPMVERVVRDGEATWSEDLRLFMHRRGFPEEVFFTFSYSPIRDESGGVGGMFCACTETTTKVQGERRLKLLRDLAAAPAEARTVADACALSAEVLRSNPQDVPFALIDLGNRGAWPLGHHPIEMLNARLPEVPAGPWPEPPRSVMVLPLADRALAETSGVIVLGVSSRLAWDDAYRGFFDLVAGQVATSIANSRASEEERKRAAALAELDRAKTAFFSNVSHEFRTPLTLMLGPLEDLASQSTLLRPEQRDIVDLARRNAQRLLKLVNTLLDFARIEAGRAQASYEPTDLAALTAELASNFRAACERAGLALTVDCPPLTAPVYVDRDMWEKIVLNLLSNAFKFTFQGSIDVALRGDGDVVELTVSDTGSGIPARELSRVFERFHRIDGARGRSHEGSGIGLALVQELVRLHKGTIRAESEEGAGARFIVTLPAGRAHLDPQRVMAPGTLASTALKADAFVEEALRWLPDAPHEPAAVSPALEAPFSSRERSGARVLVADDNADLRDYVKRLLGARYEVEAVHDGAAALAAARARPPGLVVADIMMPGLDGFALVRELRADPRLAAVPVILLSARAGEESRLEGLQQGADDYLVKPFSARELLARVESHLEISRLRREAAAALERSAEQLRVALDTARMGTWRYDPASSRMNLDARMCEIWDIPNEPVTLAAALERVHADDRERVAGAIVHALDPKRRAAYRVDFRIMFADGAQRWVASNGQARFDSEGPDGRAVELVGTALDISDLKQSEERLRDADRRKDEFIAMLAHELRNPLAAIGIAGEILGLSELPDERTRFAASVVARQMDQLQRLVDDLLDVARAMHGKLVLERRPVELGALARAVADQPNRSRVGMRISGEPAWARGDPARLRQVIDNLLDNAVKYGGRHIVIATRSAADWTEISVQDDGIGIAPELLPQLFKPFVQGEQPLERPQGGLGLGLALVDRIVALHGGAISAQSEGAGRGSTFTVRLPRAEAPNAEARGSAAGQSARRRVLIIEDEPDARDALRLLLEMDGHDVELAADGSEGLSKLADWRPEVALVDVGLPGLDGYEVARRARSFGMAGRLVALTGYGQTRDRERARAAGFDLHLVKPVSYDDLRRAFEL